MSSKATVSRPLTGRTVLLYLIGFFGVILAMNLVLVRVATSSFGGVETGNAYEAGRTFKNAIAAAHAQDARQWSVEAHIDRHGDDSLVTIRAQDAQGNPLTNLRATAVLSHPADKRRDTALELVEVEPGHFRARTTASEGQWYLIIDFEREGEKVFRSKSRIML